MYVSFCLSSSVTLLVLFLKIGNMCKKQQKKTKVNEKWIYECMYLLFYAFYEAKLFNLIYRCIQYECMYFDSI